MAEEEKRGSTRKRRIILAAGGFLLLVIVLVALAPKLLSAGPGKQFIIGKINHAIAGSVVIDQLSLSWTGPQRIKGFAMRDPAGEDVVTVDTIDAPGLSLLGVMRGNFDIGEITITKPVARIERKEDGADNITAATKSPGGGGGQSGGGDTGPPPIKGTIKIVDGEVTLIEHGQEPVVASAIGLTVDLDELNRIDLDLAATLQQGADSGSVAAIANIVDPFGNMTMDIDAELKDFPVAAVDRIAKQEGKLVALLGQQVSTTVKANAKADTQNVNITLKADHLTANDIDVTIGGGTISLNKPVQLALNVTPATWGAWAADDKATLSRAFTVKAEIARLNVPQDGSGVSVADASVVAGLEIGDIEITSADPRIGSVALRGTSLKIDGSDLQKKVNVHLQTLAEQGGQSGKVDASADLSNVFNANGEVDPKGMDAVINARVATAPLAVFDQVLNTGGVLVKALGPLLNATIDADIKSGGTSGAFELLAQSANLDADVKGDITPDRLAIRAPSRIKLKVTDALVSHYAKDMTLTNAFDTILTIDRMTLPKKGKDWDIPAAALEAKLNASNINLRRATGEAMDPLRDVTFVIKTDALGRQLNADVQTVVGGGATPGGMRIIADVTNALGADGAFNKTGAAMQGNIAVVPWPVSSGGGLPVNDLINAMVGSKLTGTIAATLKPPTQADRFAATFSTDLNSTGLSVKTAGRLDGNRAIINDGGIINLTLSPAAMRLIAQLVDKTDEDIAIASPAKLLVTLERTDINLDDPATTRLALKIAADGLALQGEQGRMIQPFVGERADLNLSAAPGGDGVMGFNIDLAAARLTVKAAGRYEAEKQVTLEDGAALDVTFTPESFAMLQPQSPWQLEDVARLKMKLDGVAFALPRASADPDQPFDLRRAKAVANITCDDLTLRRQGEQQPYRLRGINASLNARDLASSASVVASAMLSRPGSDGESMIKTDTTLTSLLNGGGQFDMSRIAVKTETRIEPSPTGMLLRLANQRETYADVLGPTMQADITGSYPGDMNVNIKSDNALVDAKLNVDEQRKLTLPSPAVVEIKPTLALAKMLFKREDAVQIDPNNPPRPFRLTISRLDVPIGELNFDALEIKNKNAAFGSDEADRFVKTIASDFTLDLGTIKIDRKSHWLIDGLLGELGRIGNTGTRQRYLDTTVTPLIATLHDGILDFEDTWIKSPTTVAGTAGRFRLTDRGYRLSVGIGGETFQHISWARAIIKPADIIEVHNIVSEDDYTKKLTKIFTQILASKGTSLVNDLGGKSGIDIGRIIGEVTKSFQPSKATMSWAHRPAVTSRKSSKDTTGESTTPSPTLPSENTNTGVDAALPDLGGSTSTESNMQPRNTETTEKKDDDPLGGLLRGVLDSQIRKRRDK